MHKFTMEEGVKGTLSVKSRNISFWFINAPEKKLFGNRWHGGGKRDEFAVFLGWGF
jgi:hypothetical protein